MAHSQDTIETIYAGNFSPTVLIAAGAALALMLALLAWREYRVTRRRWVVLSYAARMVTVCIALWLVAQPAARTVSRQESTRAISILLDTSGSMKVSDADATQVSPHSEHRLDNATRLLESAEASWLGRLEEQARVLRYRFAASPEPVASQGWGAPAVSSDEEGTDLTAALQQVVRDRGAEDIRAVVLLSDGGHNLGGDPLAAVSALNGVPVWVVPFGAANPVRDLGLHRVQAPRAVLQNDSIVVDAVIDAQGCEGEEITVQLLRDGASIAEQRILATSESYSRHLTFAHKAEQIGSEQLTISVLAVEDELTADNNMARVDVNVMEGTISVLLLDRLPRWEFRFLRNLLRRDDQVEMDYLLLSPPSSGRARGSGPVAWPRTAHDWDRYRAVVLGDIGPDTLTRGMQAGLAEYVSQRGGSVIIIAGERMPAAYAGQPLESLLPVSADDSQALTRSWQGLAVAPESMTSAIVQLVGDPAANERLWRDPFSGPAGAPALNPFSRPKPTARVLVQVPSGDAATDSGHSRAFLCWHPVGRGKVIYLSAPITYLLRQQHSDLYHHRFWGQLLRWANARDMATGSQTVQLATDKTRYSSGDDIQVTLRLRELNGEPVYSTAEQAIARARDAVAGEAELLPEDDRPGCYRATLRVSQAGPLSIEVAGEQVERLLREESTSGPVTIDVVVEPPESLEMRMTRCNLALLSRIAEATGGRVVAPAELEQALATVDFAPEVSQTVNLAPLWDRWPYLFVMVGCLTLEWALRRLLGLP